MTRLVGWLVLAAYAAWSMAALLVSGAEAGAPLVASALAAALIYGTAPHLQAEIGRIRHFERTSLPARHRRRAHLHGSESIRQA